METVTDFLGFKCEKNSQPIYEQSNHVFNLQCSDPIRYQYFIAEDLFKEIQNDITNKDNIQGRANCIKRSMELFKQGLFAFWLFKGADIIISKNNMIGIIQTKNYTGNVGNGAVQEAYAAKAHYEANFALVVTNSNYTPSAYELAEKTNIILLNDSELIEYLETIKI
jgi:hypothetical protein